MNKPDSELDVLYDEQTQALDVTAGHCVADGQRIPPAFGDLPVTALL